MSQIHGTAIVESTVQIGNNIKIGAYCVIKGNVKIGNNTILHSHVCVEGNTTIGENCEFFPFSSIGSKPQDYKFHNEETFLEIGSGNVIREYVTINPGTQHGGGLTKIGNNNFLMISSHIGHDATVGNNCTIANNVPLGGHVVLEDFITIGGNSAVHQFVRIGSYSMVGGMVGVKENIIPFSLVTPCVGSVYGGIRGVNIVGLKRKGFSKEDIHTITKAFDTLHTDDPMEEKIHKLDISNQHLQHIINFIRQSQKMEHSKGLAPFVKE
jgi:UDP-N-acetylglucosamine acyltransferase